MPEGGADGRVGQDLEVGEVQAVALGEPSPYHDARGQEQEQADVGEEGDGADPGEGRAIHRDHIGRADFRRARRDRLLSGRRPARLDRLPVQSLLDGTAAVGDGQALRIAPRHP